MPGPELFEAEERGEVILGGCCVSDDDPKYRCKNVLTVIYLVVFIIICAISDGFTVKDIVNNI